MRHLHYLRYVLRHRWFVFLACCWLGTPLCGLVHDLSKFRPSEWIPYAAYFYGPAEKKPQRKRAFLQARELHYGRNKHHPEYWVRPLARFWTHPDVFTLVTGNEHLAILPMPHKYVLEMVADWTGAGRAISGRKDWRPWYLENASQLRLHPKTRAMVEAML